MTVKTINVYGNENHCVRSNVNVAGSVLTCSGTGVMMGVSVSIPETTYTLSPHSTKISVTGYVVKNKLSGEISLMVDEVLWNGVDRPYQFDSDSGFQMMDRIFTFDVPPNSSSFDSITVLVTNIITKSRSVQQSN